MLEENDCDCRLHSAGLQQKTQTGITEYNPHNTTIYIKKKNVIGVIY